MHEKVFITSKYNNKTVPRVRATMSPSMVKITIVKVFEPKDVIGRDFIKSDGNPIPKCFLEEGQEFLVTDDGEMPEGFCQQAWHSIHTSVSLLRYGGHVPNWTGEDTLYSACPDGLRPVCFKVERVKE